MTHLDMKIRRIIVVDNYSKEGGEMILDIEITGRGMEIASVTSMIWERFKDNGQEFPYL